MIRPDERVLRALNTLDRTIFEWLNASLAHFRTELETAPAHLVPLLQGKCQALRSILDSAEGASQALLRIRQNTPGFGS